jgi:predicted aldo/keto reductase-like oxidoreductase
MRARLKQTYLPHACVAIAEWFVMIQRDLGKTGLRVGEIGLGTEHLGRTRKARPVIVDVVDKAVESGINYFDLIFNFTEYLENYGVAFKAHRDQLVLACHLGSAVTRNQQYFKTRSVGICRQVFEDTLTRLATDYIDVANVTYVKNKKEYAEVTQAGSVLDLARRLQREGKVHHIGISTHEASVVQLAAQSGAFDVITYQVNMANNALRGRNEALATVARENVGLVAMKPFAGGVLLARNRTVGVACGKRGGGSTINLTIPPEMTAVHCLAYTLAQVGVSTTIPGVRSLDQLNELLAYHSASPDERDYSGVIKSFNEYHAGQCVYCNHCLPCPSNIDIGQIMRLLDHAKLGMTAEAKAKYAALEANASDCTACDACMNRCPFDVNVVANMKEAANVFG